MGFGGVGLWEEDLDENPGGPPNKVLGALEGLGLPSRPGTVSFVRLADRIRKCGTLLFSGID